MHASSSVYGLAHAGRNPIWSDRRLDPIRPGYCTFRTMSSSDPTSVYADDPRKYVNDGKCG